MKIQVNLDGSVVVASSATRRGGGSIYTYMHYTYVLLSLMNGRLYTGNTCDLRQRLREHNSRKGGIYTQKNGPFKLIFYEAFLSKTDALKQELFYKTGYGREVLKNKIEHSLQINE